MFLIQVKDEVINEISEAYNYLEDKQVGLGERLLSTIDDYFDILRLNPTLFETDYKTIRKVKLKPFRYLIRYKIYPKRIVILQLFHGNQHPEKKRK